MSNGIGVGINENVYFSDVSRNDKNHLVISFKEDTGKSWFETMESNEIEEGEGGLTIRLFPFKVPDKDDMTGRQKMDRTSQDITKTRNMMIHMLTPFLVNSDIVIPTLEGSGIIATTPISEVEARLNNQAILDKIWINITNAFIRLLKPLCGRNDLKFRLKLTRQSTEKHFPSFPNTKYLNSEPFIEPMSIDEQHSKVKFTKYEIEKGLDKREALAASDAADPLPEEQAAMIADNSFDPAMFEAPAEDTFVEAPLEDDLPY